MKKSDPYSMEEIPQSEMISIGSEEPIEHFAPPSSRKNVSDVSEEVGEISFVETAPIPMEVEQLGSVFGILKPLEPREIFREDDGLFPGGEKPALRQKKEKPAKKRKKRGRPRFRLKPIPGDEFYNNDGAHPISARLSHLEAIGKSKESLPEIGGGAPLPEPGPIRKDAEQSPETPAVKQEKIQKEKQKKPSEAGPKIGDTQKVPLAPGDIGHNAEEEPKEKGLRAEEAPADAVGKVNFTVEVNRMTGFYADILVAAVPLLAWATYLYGSRSLMLTALSVIVCCVVSWITDLIFERTVHYTDLSPAVTGVLTALCLPVTAPLWLPLPLGIISVAVVKKLIRSFTDFRAEPTALPLLAFRLLAPALIGSFCNIFTKPGPLSVSAGSYTEAVGSNLKTILSGTLPEQSLGSSFVGFRTGVLGEMSALLLIVAGIYLVIRRVIKPAAPLAAVVTLGVLSYIFPRVIIESDIIALRYAAWQILSGDFLLCTVFLAAMPGTAPLTKRASLVYGFGLGLLTFLCRYFIGNTVTDALLPVLVMSILSRPLDLLLGITPFGGKKRTPAKV